EVYVYGACDVIGVDAVGEIDVVAGLLRAHERSVEQAGLDVARFDSEGRCAAGECYQAVHLPLRQPGAATGYVVPVYTRALDREAGDVGGRQVLQARGEEIE